ncbi:hypothetical protein ACH5RR_020670 [Cinchona calisaya]|uniref:Uncharacterized protein n=1 Tax=Cinchona calisaya TaxID=153742 RepID=A0ABD2ZGY0_9GENT
MIACAKGNSQRSDSARTKGCSFIGIFGLRERALDCITKLLWTCSFIFLVLGNSLTYDTIVYDIHSPSHRLVPGHPTKCCAEYGGVLSNLRIVAATIYFDYSS